MNDVHSLSYQIRLLDNIYGINYECFFIFLFYRVLSTLYSLRIVSPATEPSSSAAATTVVSPQAEAAKRLQSAKRTHAAPKRRQDNSDGDDDSADQEVCALTACPCYFFLCIIY